MNCTQCGAPLTLHGGHRVLSITCSYCGSQLDAKHEYRLVRKFVERDRPLTPIELGMTGTFKGVEFTVIALVQYRTVDGYGWLEFALFSPTHGYAWLEETDGHFVFSRRTRDLPSTPVRARTRSTFEARGRTFRVFESYLACVVYVEGELTFVSRTGDRVRIIEAISPPYAYSVERTESEEEYVLGEYVPATEVYRTLGLANDPPRPRSVHPAQPYLPSRLVSELSRVAWWYVPVAALALVAVLVLGGGHPLLTARFGPRVFQEGVQSQPFHVEEPGKLLRLRMFSAMSNAWADYDIQVAQGERPVFSMAKQISYYSGYESGEHWSEGSQSASAYFKLPQAGDYRLVVRAQGGSQGRAGRSTSPPPRSELVVRVSEGIIVSRYFVALLAICALAASARHLARWRFEARRWEDAGDDD